MENNIQPVLFKLPGDISAQGIPVSQPHVDLEAFQAAFADLLQRSGNSLDSGLTVKTDNVGRQISAPDSELTSLSDEPATDDSAQAHNRHDESSRSNDDDSYRDAPRPDRHDNGRDHDNARQVDDHGAATRGDGDTEVVHRSDERSQDQNQSANNVNDSDQSTTDSNGAGSDRQNSDQGQNTAQNGKDNGSASYNEVAAKTDDSGAAPVNSGLNNAEALLGELLAAAEASFASGVGVEGAAGQNDGAAKAENALQGLAKAIASLGNNGIQQQSSLANAQNQSPELQALAKAIIGAQGEAKASNETGSANNANNRQQQIQDLAQKLGDGNLNQANLGINKQAQDLAQKIGDGNRAQVNVNVTKEAESLVSQTSSSLSPNAALAGDAQSLPLRAQQAMTAANNPGGQAAALNNAAQNQQAANQSAQQAVNSIGAEAKAIGPVASNASAQGGTSGGGEGSSATNAQSGSQEAREAQQSSQTQSSNANRANGQRQAVMDKISVNITRAVNAGLDKINIQLQPESLGKVDVNLELAKDGKITAVIHAENKDTLELLSRDVKELTKALQEAGIQLDESDIEFNLSGQSDEAGEGSFADGTSADDDNSSDDAELAALNDNIDDEDIIEDDRVNIRV